MITTALTLMEMFKEEHEIAEQNRKNGGSRYAPDLNTEKQKKLRAKKIAMYKAARRYMFQEGIGYEWIKPDIVLDEHRANHFGVAIGTMVGYNSLTSEDYDTQFARVLKRIRKEVTVLD